MKTKHIALFLLLFVPSFLMAGTTKQTENESRETLTQQGYTLIFINKDKSFSEDISEKLKETFFKVYPELAKAYNKETAQTVTFVIDPAYDGVAATSDDRVVYNPRWFDKHPGDIDVVTHEVMHIVQAYGDTPGPWWITEGIADYVRFKYGVDNGGAGWSLPDVNEKQNYDNSYRVTARFFAWIVKNKDKDFVKKMDDIMRNHTYTDQSWVELTGKTPAALWEEYKTNPTI
jgi:hypothetical protein